MGFAAFLARRDGGRHCPTIRRTSSPGRAQQMQSRAPVPFAGLRAARGMLTHGEVWPANS